VVSGSAAAVAAGAGAPAVASQRSPAAKGLHKPAKHADLDLGASHVCICARGVRLVSHALRPRIEGKVPAPFGWVIYPMLIVFKAG
jgi:hypothetical protein